MNTENTEYVRGWVFYDGDCAFCSGWVAPTHNLLVRHGFHPVPLHSRWAIERLGLDPAAPLVEMKFLTVDGKIFGGADALVQIARAFWWAWPIYMFAQVPGAKSILRALYRRMAANRHCLGNKCSAPASRAKPGHHITSSFYELP